MSFVEREVEKICGSTDRLKDPKAFHVGNCGRLGKR